jgi:hypothetical protein
MITFIRFSVKNPKLHVTKDNLSEISVMKIIALTQN